MFESYLQEFILEQLHQSLELVKVALAHAAGRVPVDKRLAVVRTSLAIGRLGQALAKNWGIDLSEEQ